MTEPEPLRGDVDGNGEVSVDDAQRTLLEYVRIMAGLTGNFSDVQKRAGDINGDDQISVDDAQMILLYYVNNTLSGKKVTWDELLNKAKPTASLPVPAKIAKRFSDR